LRPRTFLRSVLIKRGVLPKVCRVGRADGFQVGRELGRNHNAFVRNLQGKKIGLVEVETVEEKIE
jgi:hypothetical protein